MAAGALLELVTDAIQAGNTVLVVRTHDAADLDLARATLKASFRGRDGITSETS